MAYDEDLIKNPKGGMPRLIEIMRTLRDPDAGCPWDIEQTFETIAPYTIEEPVPKKQRLYVNSPAVVGASLNSLR